MLVRIKIYDESGSTFYKPINVFNISDLDFANPKDIEQGTIINLRTGASYISPEPIDKVDLQIQGIFERYAALITVQVAGELGKMIKKPRPRKRS